MSPSVHRQLDQRKRPHPPSARAQTRRRARRADDHRLQHPLRTRRPVPGLAAGGIGAIHLLAQKLGLIRDIDDSLHLLKRHLPYHESDHVLNIAFNILAGGTRLEHLELRRNDEVYLDALGAERIPDPTTAGDFCRRFARGRRRWT